MNVTKFDVPGHAVADCPRSWRLIFVENIQKDNRVA